jgi:hypothetical protein
MKPATQRLGIFFSVLLFIALTASAQNNRSFVSTTGSDANTCTPGNECRSFTRAMVVTNPGGEIVAENSGGYGPFTISQAVTVVSAPGAYAAITSASDGVDVFAGASDRVVLRGLNINLTGASSVGIYGIIYGSLFIEGCTVTGGRYGIDLAPSSLSPAMVSDSVVRAASVSGYLVTGHATLVRCRAELNGSVGLSVLEGTGADGVVSAIDFVAVANNAHGAFAFASTAGHTVELNLDRALASNNTQDGIFAEASGGALVNVRVSNSTVTNNGGYGFDQQGTAYFGSMNNNLVAGNTSGDTNGTISLVTVR